MGLNYDDLGLKVGFEFHQQLDTDTKLFCNCESRMVDEEKPDFSFIRKLNPTKSEFGDIDRAALEEKRASKIFKYAGYWDNTCLVECDEEPPKIMNDKALDIAVQIALLLDSKIVDQLHTMRKIVIDGSNTTGFQRTAVVSKHGSISTEEGEIGIENICIEEESAQKLEERSDEGIVIYGLDRLGIPLIEIGSCPDIRTPREAKKFAENVGMILRSTENVVRGIGSIRQDLNISIKEGSRIELKGVQELDLIEDYIDKEIKRQLSLLEIKEILEERKTCKEKIEDVGPVRVSEIFHNTDSDIIKKGMEEGEVLAVNLPGFSGLLGKEIQPKRRLGTELSDRAKKIANIGGVFHTDELPGYGISREEVKEIREVLDSGPTDCVVLVADLEKNARRALEAVIERAKICFEGVPEETRRPLKNGCSKYMRPLPGSERMYPETDIPPINIDEDRIKRLESNLPELISERISRYVETYNISKEIAEKIASSSRHKIFDKAMENFNISPTLVCEILTDIFKEIEKDGYDSRKIKENHLVDIFRLLDSDKVSQEVVSDIMYEIAKGSYDDVSEVIDSLSIEKVEKDVVRETVKEVVSKKEELIREEGMRATGPLMGVIMKELERRADGEEVNRILREELKKKIGRDCSG